MTPALNELLDKAAIERVLYDYCSGIDRCDEELLRSVYHDDSYDDHGVYKGDGPGFVTFALKALERDLGTQHLVSNVRIDLEGDGKARCESYLIGRHLREVDGELKLLTYAGAVPRPPREARRYLADRPPIGRRRLGQGRDRRARHPHTTASLAVAAAPTIPPSTGTSPSPDLERRRAAPSELVEGPVALPAEDQLAERLVPAPRRDGVLTERLQVAEPLLDG